MPDEFENEPMMSRENKAFVAVLGAIVFLLFMLGLSAPNLLVEDGLVEDLSAAGFAVAALLALNTGFLKNVSLTFTDRCLLIGTGVLSLVLFLSEISFGARIFHVQMPKMKGGGEFDGGHDIVILVFRTIRDAGSAGILVAMIGVVLLLAVAVALLLRFRREAEAMVRYILARTFEFRLLLAICMLASAVILDLIPSYKAATLEEILEFSASGVLILAVAGLRWRKGPSLVRRDVRTKNTIRQHWPRQL
ncbi:hypothetical protein [Candidatus Phyllobacterium onerii]|uniref:hypothetical protein n=1 Tax=Candidatus Phyllobacterium onerii TaxID=3020828 RepID=UPI00233057DB|nr:hypothetical protein [Phyllobacterium sp. IY22]